MPGTFPCTIRELSSFPLSFPYIKHQLLIRLPSKLHTHIQFLLLGLHYLLLKQLDAFLCKLLDDGWILISLNHVVEVGLLVIV